jgi:hypothetical protein
MGRDTTGRQRQLREEIARLAARLVVEDGLEDWGLAKRKAARTLGLTDARALPTNSELEAAVLDHQRIFDEDGQREALAWLRAQALDLMELFARFDPHVCGPVLSGAIGRYPTIHLHLFADDEKAIELFLLNEAVPYHPSQQRLFVAGAPRTVPCFELNVDGTDVHALQFTRADRHQPVRLSAEGRALDRAARASLVARMDQAAALHAEGVSGDGSALVPGDLRRGVQR